MPVVINKGDLKYKGTDNEYHSFNTVAGVDKKSSEIISEIQTEGASQISAIEAKGKTTKESIPEDYSELTGDVTAIKDGKRRCSITWVNGQISSDGSYNPSATNWHCTDFIAVSDINGGTFVVDGTLVERYSVWTYKSDQTFRARADNITATTPVPSFAADVVYIRINAYSTDYNNLSIIADLSFVTDLSDSISSINTKVDTIDTKANTIDTKVNTLCGNLNSGNYDIDFQWETGTLSSTDGTEQESSVNSRSTFLSTALLKRSTMTVNTGMLDRVNTWLYKSDKSFKGRGSSITQTTDMSEFISALASDVSYIRFGVYKTDYNLVTLFGKSEFYCDLQDKIDKLDDYVDSVPDPTSIVQLNLDRKTLLYNANYPRTPYKENPYTVLGFIHFSDIHNRPIEWSRVCEFADEYKDLIQFCIHTGDYCGSNQSEYTDLYATKSPTMPILNCVGNHDIIDSSTTKQSQATTRSLLFNHTDNWGVTFPTDDVMYYYRDFSSANIRLIVLDQYYSDDTERSWLENLLSDAKDKGLAVITASHTQTSEVINKVSSFNTFDSFNLSEQTNGFEDLIKNFKDNGGIHIVHLCGHWHWDNFGYDSNGILNEIVECSTIYAGNWNNDIRKAGTRSYDCFDAVFIDENTKTLRIIRIGSNADQYLRAKNVVTVDYANNQVLVNW